MMKHAFIFQLHENKLIDVSSSTKINLNAPNRSIIKNNDGTSITISSIGKFLAHNKKVYSKQNDINNIE